MVCEKLNECQFLRHLKAMLELENLPTKDKEEIKKGVEGGCNSPDEHKICSEFYTICCSEFPCDLVKTLELKDGLAGYFGLLVCTNDAPDKCPRNLYQPIEGGIITSIERATMEIIKIKNQENRKSINGL